MSGIVPLCHSFVRPLKGQIKVGHLMSFHIFQIWFCFVSDAIQKLFSSRSGADQTYTGCKQQLKGELKSIALLYEIRESGIYGIGNIRGMSCL